MTDPKHTNTDSKIERCGYCGRYFIDDTYVPEATLLMKSAEELNSYSLGYCPEAQGEHAEQEASKEQYVTREMALDAGMPEIEGQRL